MVVSFWFLFSTFFFSGANHFLLAHTNKSRLRVLENLLERNSKAAAHCFFCLFVFFFFHASGSPRFGSRAVPHHPWGAQLHALELGGGCRSAAAIFAALAASESLGGVGNKEPWVESVRLAGMSVGRASDIRVF